MHCDAIHALNFIELSVMDKVTILGITMPVFWFGALAVAILAIISIWLLILRSKKQTDKSDDAAAGYRSAVRTGAITTLCMVLVFTAVTVSCLKMGYLGEPKPVVDRSSPVRTAIEQSADLPIEQRVAAIVESMTLEQKAAQMVQDHYNGGMDIVTLSNPIGSMFTGGGSVDLSRETPEEWTKRIASYQRIMLKSDVPIPIMYGADCVHGNGKTLGSVIYPHNIGIGAANDPELTRRMGIATAEEMKLDGILFNFSPCIAVSEDPRWGRTYECYSSDAEIVSSLGKAYSEGLLSAGVMPTAKHFVCDGATQFGTGVNDTNGPLDRGDAAITDEELYDIYLKPYQAQIDAGVMCVMASFSSINGEKNHCNKRLLTDILKGEMGFDGFVVSDYLGAGLVDDDYYVAICKCANAGVDMFMEPFQSQQCIDILVQGVNAGDIPMERIDDAVSRILRAKIKMNVLDDPYQEQLTHEVDAIGSEEYRELAKQLVEKSMVLLKNDNDILPFAKGTKIYVTGDALDDVGVQCGGWTLSWQGQTKDVFDEYPNGVSILDGLNQYAKHYGLEIITDAERMNEADVVLLAIGERPYAEWEGDVTDLSITSGMCLSGNENAIRLAKLSRKPVVTLIVAGRNVLISDYIDSWDAAVMCYLPGTQGDGIAAVLTGESDFSGKLPMPWYYSNKDIAKKDGKLLFDKGYGLTYADSGE